MSKLSEYFKANKTKLNKELDRQKPRIIREINEELDRLSKEDEDITGDLVEDAIISLVKKLPVFGMASILLTTMIAGIDFDELLGLENGIDHVKTRVANVVNGARL